MPLSSVHALPRRLIVATGNSGKLREFQSLLAGLPCIVESLGELRLGVPEETGTTFIENALLKARHALAAAAAIRPEAAAIADDSGLEVDALGGAPGVFSARYAGPQADDAANNAKLSAALKGVPPERRRARYRCALAMAFPSARAAPLIAEGVWEGYILESPRGAHGFGYDPYFWLPEWSMTAAELEPGDKNRLSHRAQAMQVLREQLQVPAGFGARR